MHRYMLFSRISGEKVGFPFKHLSRIHLNIKKTLSVFIELCDYTYSSYLNCGPYRHIDEVAKYQNSLRGNLVNLRLVVTVALLFTGCKALPDGVPSSGVTTTNTTTTDPGHNDLLVKLKWTASDVRVGAPFAVRADVFNAPANEEVLIQVTSDGVTVDTSRQLVQTNELGQGTVLIQAEVVQPNLPMLGVTVTTSAGEASDLVLVDFPDTTNVQGSLQAQNLGSGTLETTRTYLNGLPVATTLSDVDGLRASGTPAFYIENVQFLDDSGSLGEPVTTIELGGSETEVETLSPAQFGSCDRASTSVYLKMSTDGRLVPVPDTTRVFITARTTPNANPVTVVKYVGTNGLITFDMACNSSVHFRLEAYMPNGLTMRESRKTFLWSWGHTLKGTNLNATTVRGRTVNFTSTAQSSIARLALTLWFRTNQVYNWERTTPGSPYTNNRFALDIVYPAFDFSNNARSRAAIGQMQITDGDALVTRTIFHEFGHEVYYRRLLGGPAFEDMSRRAVAGNAHYPLCEGSTRWQPWAYVDGCAGMLEGFALWFESVATRRLGVAPLDAYIFQPEVKEVGSRFNTTAATPGRVAQYLWDAVDVHLPASSLTIEQNRFRSTDSSGAAGDTIPSGTADTDARYNAVARLFTVGSANVNDGLGQVFRNSIWPALSSDGRPQHCATLAYNTLERQYPCTP